MFPSLVYNIHVYNDQGALPAASAFNLDKPVYLGEFGETSAQGDQHQNDVVWNFYKAAQSGGWAGAFYWCLGTFLTSTRLFQG